MAIVYPDREPDGLGTLFIPNTLAIIKGAPHRKKPRALADYLLSPEVEAALASGPSAQIPLLKSTNVRGAGRDAQDRPRDGGRLRGGGEALGQVSPHSSSPSSRRLNRSSQTSFWMRDHENHAIVAAFSLWP